MENTIWAILISIVISYGTTFSTPHITKFFTSISKSLKEKSKRKKLRFDATVQFVLDNPQEEIILRIRYLQLSTFSFILLVFGVSQFFSNNPVAIIAGLFFGTFGIYADSKSNKFGNIIKEIKTRKKQLFPNIDLF